MLKEQEQPNQTQETNFPSYDAAQKDESLIQLYLTGIHAKFPKQVKGLVYDPNLEQAISFLKKISARVPQVQETVELLENMNGKIKYKVGPGIFFGMRMPQTIYVTKRGFLESGNELTLKSDLLFHEGRHVRDIYYGIEIKEGFLIDYKNAEQIGDAEIFNAILELRAEETHYRFSKKAGLVGKEFYALMVHEIKKYVDILSQKELKTRFQETAIITTIRSVDDILMQQ